MRAMLFLAAAALTGAAGCAPPPNASTGPETASAEGRQCFRPNLIRNFRGANGQTLYVRSNDNQVFAISGAGGCWDIQQANSIVLTPTLPGSDLCVGDPARLAAVNRTCQVRVQAALSEEEVAALPRSDRP